MTKAAALFGYAPRYRNSANMNLSKPSLLVVSGQLLALPSTTFGDPGCSEWFVQPSATKKLWLMVFLSSMNVAENRSGTPSKDTLGVVTSANPVFFAVDNFCRGHPKGTMEASHW